MRFVDRSLSNNLIETRKNEIEMAENLSAKKGEEIFLKR